MEWKAWKPRAVKQNSKKNSSLSNWLTGVFRQGHTGIVYFCAVWLLRFQALHESDTVVPLNMHNKYVWKSYCDMYDYKMGLQKCYTSLCITTDDLGTISLGVEGEQ